MAKNKDGDGEGAAGAAQEGSSSSPGRPVSPSRGLGETERGREGEGEAGTAREGGLPTSDPADGGHMAAASQIKRLRLGGSAITAV